ncbi:MAG: hypothetical protein CVV02_15485 [Firmicutes bacterium HGW-Firmicutes-7]|nr:MAG: hypothetical protein CVV02_15485 [Firmicutes bacterium HGW-Firmicutes-7]
MKKKIGITMILLVICVVGLLVGLKIRNNQIIAAIERDVIYEGIYIEDIHIGGLRKNEAIDVVKSNIEKQNGEKQIKLLIEGKTAYLLPYNYFEHNIDYASLVDKAYEIGRTGTNKDRYKLIKEIEKMSYIIEVEETFSDEKINEILETAKKEHNVLPQDAVLSRINNAFVIQDEVIGKNLLIDKSLKAIKEALIAGLDEVNLQLEQTNPHFTKAIYEDIKDILGSYYTEFSATQKARNENLRIASEKINGKILMPGDVFSTNETIGPVNLANGYQEAPIILNGKIQPGIGGGVCQIATTLYNAVLLSELEVVQRQNHSLPVGYIEKARDATLAGDYIDFKFKNNTKYPVYIESYIKNQQLYMNIYGKEMRASNRRIGFESVIINTIMPPPQKTTLDPSLEEGQEVVEKKSTIGYTVKLYKLIYIDEKLSDKITVNTSNYRATAAEVRRGSAPIAEEQPITAPAIHVEEDPIIEDESEQDADQEDPDQEEDINQDGFIGNELENIEEQLELIP